jgi:phenylalanyl-tRNA synthetase alpha chain
MLNLVEMGLPMEEREERMKQLASWIAEAAGLKDFELSVTWSEVYGESIDVLAGKQRLEVASGAIGPHVLDRAWKINEPWVGIGFGLERLLMAAGKGENISRLGPSLSYVNGIRLNI